MEQAENSLRWYAMNYRTAEPEHVQQAFEELERFHFAAVGRALRANVEDEFSPNVPQGQWSPRRYAFEVAKQMAENPIRPPARRK